MDLTKYRVSAHLPESLLTWGTVEVVGDETLTAGESCDLEVRVALHEAIPAGLSVEVWTHFVSDLDRVQAEDNDQPAHFSCESDGPSIEPRTYPEAKVHGSGSFFPYRRYAAIALPGGASPGDDFTFYFRRVHMQTYEETLFNLRFALVASERDEVIGYLGDAFYRVVGGPPAALRLVAPTCVEIDEPFDCRIVVVDRHGNKTGVSLEVFDFDLQTADGPAPVSLGAVTYDPEWRRHTASGLACGAEGVYYLHARVRGTDPEVAGTSNPIVARVSWGDRLYWGDVHQHAYYGDGRGTPAANYEYAISTACLDFCAVAPHEELLFAPGLQRIPSPPQTGWEELVEAAERYDGKELVTILGSEAGSLARVAAHMNAYYLDHSNRPEIERLIGRWWELPERPRLESYRQYLDELERSTGEYLLLPHAHARGGPGQFDLPVLPAYQTNVEICSVHGVFEAFYAQWLKHGHYVGVHGSGDNHMTSTGNGNPGYHYPNTNGLAAAWGAARTRRGVWDAFKHRATYAVTGNQRIYLDLRVAGQPMGSVIVGGTGPRAIHIEVAGTAPVMRVDLLRNGEVIRTYRPALEAREAGTVRVVWTDDWCSRRVDDSLTTGTISLEGGRLSLLARLNAYHRTDSFCEQDGAIAFRSNGYSGITRGLLARVSDAHGALRFQIEDRHLDEVVLDASMVIPLGEDHVRLTRPLVVSERFTRPLFTREPHHPQFILDVDWVDPDWPWIARLDWEDDTAEPAYYTVRVEQIDGNIAWSSPVWFVDRLPEFEIPGNVVITLP